MTNSSRSRRRLRCSRWLALAGAAVLLAAACGDSDDGSDAAPATTAAP